MIVVGGGRRSLPSHDGDFVITHPTRYSFALLLPYTCLHKHPRMHAITPPRHPLTPTPPQPALPHPDSNPRHHLRLLYLECLCVI